MILLIFFFPLGKWAGYKQNDALDCPWGLHNQELIHGGNCPMYLIAVHEEMYFATSDYCFPNTPSLHECLSTENVWKPTG